MSHTINRSNFSVEDLIKKNIQEIHVFGRNTSDFLASLDKLDLLHTVKKVTIDFPTTKSSNSKIAEYFQRKSNHTEITIRNFDYDEEILKAIATNKNLDTFIVPFTKELFDEKKSKLLFKYIPSNIEYLKLSLHLKKALFLQDFISELKNFPNLKSLNLEKNELGEKGAEYISRYLKSNKYLEELNLNECQMKASTLLLLQSLESNKTLKKIHIANNRVPIKIMKLIFERIEYFNFQEIDFSLNQIDSTLLETFFNHLIKNKSLKYVRIDYGNYNLMSDFQDFTIKGENYCLNELSFYCQDTLGETELKSMCNALKKFKSLKTFSISYELNLESTKSIFDLIESNQSIEKLNIEYDFQDETAFEAIFKLLSKNKSLNYLKLSQISMNQNDSFNFLQENNTLKTLEIELCDINTESLSNNLRLNKSLKKIKINNVGDDLINPMKKVLKENKIIEEIEILPYQDEVEKITKKLTKRNSSKIF